MPTCLVITSSESASSIDTQFSALIQEIYKKCKARSIELDAKKCATMRSTIEMIQMKMKMMFGMQIDTADDAQGRDKRNFFIGELHSSEEEEEGKADEENKSDAESDDDSDDSISNHGQGNEVTGAQMRVSSNYVSTLQDPSYCIESSHKVSNIYANHPCMRQSMGPTGQLDPRDGRFMSAQQDMSQKLDLEQKLTLNNNRQSAAPMTH